MKKFWIAVNRAMPEDAEFFETREKAAEAAELMSFEAGEDGVVVVAEAQTQVQATVEHVPLE